MVVSCDVWRGQTAAAAKPVTPPITSYQWQRRENIWYQDQTSHISVLGNAEASAYLQVNSGGVRAPSLLHWRSKGQWWRQVFIDKLIFLETSILMFAVAVNFGKNSHFQTSICSPPFPCHLSVGKNSFLFCRIIWIIFFKNVMYVLSPFPALHI